MSSYIPKSTADVVASDASTRSTMLLMPTASVVTGRVFTLLTTTGSAFTTLLLIATGPGRVSCCFFFLPPSTLSRALSNQLLSSTSSFSFVQSFVEKFCLAAAKHTTIQYIFSYNAYYKHHSTIKILKITHIN